jgi:myo-inositol-1(or 4)-monophosphatase
MIRSPLMTVMVDAVMKAAKGLRRDFGEIENLQVSRKGPGDFVTQADHKAEKVIYESLLKARPDFGFVMEESGHVEGKDTSHRWHIDPLDGTMNFLHGMPHFSISVALEREGQPIAGVVYDPIKDELFIAEKGKGAFLNNRRLRVSGRTDLSESMFSTGVPASQRSNPSIIMKEFSHVTMRSASVRCLGSAALDLSYVAAGRLEGFWETGISSWDIAAGIVLVREAGGQVSDVYGADYTIESGSILATNMAIHTGFAKLLKDARAA